MAEEGGECKDLPEECWELIFTFLHHRYFDSISLVSRLFLSLTNRLRRSLAVSPPTASLLPSLLRRFRHLKSLDFSRFPHQPLLLHALSLVATSELDLQSFDLSTHKSLPDESVLAQLGSRMKNLHTLICSKMASLGDTDLVLIAHSFPNLQHLDISYPDTGSASGYPVTDNGIVELSRRLPELRRINLSGNQCVTDLSLLALTAGSCVRLRQIDLRDCDLVTQKGIDLCLRRFRELDSLSAAGIGIGIGIRSINPSFVESFAFARALRALDLSNSVVSDELLGSITEADLPLKKLDLSLCQKLSYSSIRKLLCKYQFLDHLGLQAVDLLTDQRVTDLSKFLSNLTSINLNSCSKLTIISLLELSRACPMLEEIKMERTNLGKEDKDEGLTAVVNGRVRSLHLASNRNLSDECIRKIVPIFPNVETMDVSHCLGTTDQGIAEILLSLKELRHLEMSHCQGIEDVGTEMTDCKLEVLIARRSGIKDKALVMIGNKCPRLYKLDLGCSMDVTAQGVKEVVKRCRLLRDLNLICCSNVSSNVVASMVFSSSSLRRIVPPPCTHLLTIQERNLYLRHGCLVCPT